MCVGRLAQIHFSYEKKKSQSKKLEKQLICISNQEYKTKQKRQQQQETPKPPHKSEAKILPTA